MNAENSAPVVRRAIATFRWHWLPLPGGFWPRPLMLHLPKLLCCCMATASFIHICRYAPVHCFSPASLLSFGWNYCLRRLSNALIKRSGIYACLLIGLLTAVSVFQLSVCIFLLLLFVFSTLAADVFAKRGFLKMNCVNSEVLKINIKKFGRPYVENAKQSVLVQSRAGYNDAIWKTNPGSLHTIFTKATINKKPLYPPAGLLVGTPCTCTWAGLHTSKGAEGAEKAP